MQKNSPKYVTRSYSDVHLGAQDCVLCIPINLRENNLFELELTKPINNINLKTAIACFTYYTRPTDNSLVLGLETQSKMVGPIGGFLTSTQSVDPQNRKTTELLLDYTVAHFTLLPTSNMAAIGQ